MLTAESAGKSEHEVKGSRFIGYVVKVNSSEKVKDEAVRLRKAHSGSDHVVYAFIAGQGGEIEGMNDDREPKGSAGRPLLDLLRGKGVTNTALLVVRYFGGTKLGIGGLSRAYRATGKAALDNTVFQELTVYRRFTIMLTYEIYEQTRKILINAGSIIDTEDFLTRVKISGRIPESETAAAGDLIKDLSKGECFLQVD